MRRFLLAATAVSLLASPAWALRITNLDKVPHTITYETLGNVFERTIAPNATTRFDGLPNGRLSLVTAAVKKQGGPVEGTGIITKYIGNGRNQGIPADIRDDYVIWPGGEIGIQRRMKNNWGR